VSQGTWTNILTNVNALNMSVEALFGAEEQGIDNFILHANLLQPVGFCTSKSGLACGPPVIVFNGSPSATANSGFEIIVAPAHSCRTGVGLYNTTQSTPMPFQGGTLCIEPQGLRRAGPTNSGGTPGNNCDGAFSIDMNTFTQGLWQPPGCAGNPAGIPANNPAAFLKPPGAIIHYQFWGRDSMATGSLVSDGLSYPQGP
jgi:hypothetical protein